MALIGYLGRDPEDGIPFIVSREVFRTPKGMTWGGSARYATHARHATHALTEFTGLDPDTFSFDMLLTAELGVNPMDELVKLWNYERDAEAVGLVIGGHGYGKYRWTVKSHETKIEHTDAAGDLYAVEVSVELLEYLKGETHNFSEKPVEPEEPEEPAQSAKPVQMVLATILVVGNMQDTAGYGGSSCTVTSGDSLWSLAEKYYGDGSQWRRIYDANRDVIGGNPNLIYPGQTYIIP